MKKFALMLFMVLALAGCNDSDEGMKTTTNPVQTNTETPTTNPNQPVGIVTPEPGTIALFGFGVGILLAGRRRKGFIKCAVIAALISLTSMNPSWAHGGSCQKEYREVFDTLEQAFNYANEYGKGAESINIGYEFKLFRDQDAPRKYQVELTFNCSKIEGERNENKGH